VKILIVQTHEEIVSILSGKTKMSRTVHVNSLAALWTIMNML